MKSGGCDQDRHRYRLTEHGRAHVAPSDSRQHAVIKFQPFPAGGVLAQRDFIERAAFVIIAHLFRELIARCPNVVGDVQQEFGFHTSYRSSKLIARKRLIPKLPL